MPKTRVVIRMKRSDNNDVFIAKDVFSDDKFVGCYHLGQDGEWHEMGENTRFDSVFCWRKGPWQGNAFEPRQVTDDDKAIQLLRDTFDAHEIDPPQMP